MLRARGLGCWLHLHTRLYSTSSSPKSTLQLVAELRKQTDVSISKAREALHASNNDVVVALEWLRKDLIASRAQKAAKLEGRFAGEGLISVSVLNSGRYNDPSASGIRAAMIELNCETDFVGRNKIFGKLAADIAYTAAFITESVPRDLAELFVSCPLEMLNNAPLLSENEVSGSSLVTVGDSIQDTITKVGEKISLRRAMTVVWDAYDPKSLIRPDSCLRLASWTHGDSAHCTNQGRVGALVSLLLRSPRLTELFKDEGFRTDLGYLERSLARQIVGFDTECIESPGKVNERALYQQPFMMSDATYSGKPIGEALNLWVQQHHMVVKDKDNGLDVQEFAKWRVGEDIIQ